MRSILSPHQSSPSLHSTGKSGLNPRTFPSAMLASPPASDRKWAPTVGTPAASSESTSLKRSGTRLLLFRDNFTWVWRGAVQLTVFDYRLFFHLVDWAVCLCITTWRQVLGNVWRNDRNCRRVLPVTRNSLSYRQHCLWWDTHMWIPVLMTL